MVRVTLPAIFEEHFLVWTHSCLHIMYSLRVYMYLTQHLWVVTELVSSGPRCQWCIPTLLCHRFEHMGLNLSCSEGYYTPPTHMLPLLLPALVECPRTGVLWAQVSVVHTSSASVFGATCVSVSYVLLLQLRSLPRSRSCHPI